LRVAGTRGAVKAAGAGESNMSTNKCKSNLLVFL